VAKCIAALHNVTTPRVDGITTPLLKAGLEPTAWLHRVILVVLHSGRPLRRGNGLWWFHYTRARARTSARITTKESVC